MIRAVIVDDEAPARDRLRQMLAPDAVLVVGEAGDGEEAVSRIDELRPDLVFLDIQMPALTGLEVVSRLHAPRPRIVFCTAYDHFAIEAFELHAVDYLLKPVNRDRLARTVDRIRIELDEQRRITRERAEAVRTQRRLMPGDLGGGGFECAGACEPADGVGGDYYDFLPLPGNRLGIALGDVSGKGMYAGLLAAALQARLQAITAHGPESPADVVRELNRLTAGTIEGNRFATLFFGVFDPDAATLTYVNAGHPPAAVISPRGGIQLLDSTAPAIGLVGDADFREAVISLSPGDLFATFSDGLSEAESCDGEPLGVDGVTRILRGHRGMAPRVIADATLAEVRRLTADAPPSDDRTLVVARLAGPR
jgi:sigma-B regulation protein RsbU (phosphoserine phosphatase)